MAPRTVMMPALPPELAVVAAKHCWPLGRSVAAAWAGIAPNMACARNVSAVKTRMIVPTPDGLIFLAIAYALMLFAVLSESKIVWLVLIFIAYEFEWMRAIPAAWHELSTTDKGWYVACMFLIGLTLGLGSELLSGLRRWQRKRVSPGSESRESVAQERIDTARRISFRG